MAAPSVTISVMLAVHEKKASSVNMYKPLRKYIARNFSERQAQEAEQDLQAVQQMRNAVEKASDSLESRRDLLQRYFRALCVMECRLGISDERQHVNSLSFAWYDAFKQSKKASQQSIHFEKAAVMFNLGAVQSQLALSADRTTAAGLKQACNCYQAAAGAFALLRDSISVKAASGSSTLDISVDCAGMLEKLMLAQAQECFFEKVTSDQKPHSLCAKVARQVGLYYEEAYAALVLPPLNQHFDRTWVAHVQLKAAQFHGEACYRTALALHEEENVAEEIARLKVASSVLSAAKKSGKGAVGPLVDALSKLETNVNLNLERAEKENDRVYLMRIPSLNSLSPLPAASLVKSTSLVDVLDISNETLFSGIVPDSSAKAVSRYTEMLDNIIRVQLEKLQQQSEITKVKLKDMDLPASLHALEGQTTLPYHLRQDVEAAQLDGGPSGLEAEMKHLRDLRRANEEALLQVEELLRKEAREDGQFRKQFGARWTRARSSTLTKHFQDRLSSFSEKLKQAAEMDARIERTIKDNRSLMAILDVTPIETALPALGKPEISLSGDKDAIVGALKNSLGQLEILGSQCAGLEEMLKEIKRKDDILPKLMSSSGSYEDLFKRELDKYNPICQEIAKNVEAQEELLQQIKVQHDAFSAIFKLEDFKASQDQAYQQISLAVSKYHEIHDNIVNEGMKFYITLQDAINNLKQQCDDYVRTRNIQCQDLVEDLQQHMAGFSLRDGNSSLKYPLVHQPSQWSSPGIPLSNVHSSQSGPQNPLLPPQPYLKLQQHPQMTYFGGHQAAAAAPSPPYYNSPEASVHYSQGVTTSQPMPIHDYRRPQYLSLQTQVYSAPAIAQSSSYPPLPPYHLSPAGYYPPPQGDYSK